MSKLLSQPFTLPCGVELPNRVVKAALSEGLATPSNDAGDLLVQLYETWSRSGCGTLLTGNVMVDRGQLDKPGNVVIDGHEDTAALARWAAAATSGGVQAWMQVNHTGRQSALWCTESPHAPSAVAVDVEGFATPVEMSVTEIHDVIARLARAAMVARDAGFTGVQLHAAHGYLASQFLSPLANHRTDRWGGSLQNRARFLLLTIRAIRSAVGPRFPVSVKLNSADFQKGGFSHEECLKVVTWLNAESIDLLEVSGGTYEQMAMAGHLPIRESTRQREAYFLEYAESIRRVAEMPMMLTGGFRTIAGMEEAIESGATDLIGLGRPLCSEPDGVVRLLDGQIDRLGAYEARVAQEMAELPKPMGKAVKFESGLFWANFHMQRIGHGEHPDASISAAAAREGAAEHDHTWLRRWNGPATRNEGEIA